MLIKMVHRLRDEASRRYKNAVPGSEEANFAMETWEITSEIEVKRASTAECAHSAYVRAPEYNERLRRMAAEKWIGFLKHPHILPIHEHAPEGSILRQVTTKRMAEE